MDTITLNSYVCDKATVALCYYLNNGGAVNYVTECYRCHVATCTRSFPTWLTWEVSVNEFNIVGKRGGQIMVAIVITAGDNKPPCILTTISWIEVRALSVLMLLDVGNAPSVITIQNNRKERCRSCSTKPACLGDGRCFTIDSEHQNTKWQRDYDCGRECKLVACPRCCERFPLVFFSGHGKERRCVACALAKCMKERKSMWDCKIPGCRGKIYRAHQDMCSPCFKRWKENRALDTHCSTPGCTESKDYPDHLKCRKCYLECLNH